MDEWDELIEQCKGSQDCPPIYSVHYGYENIIMKRMEYMKMLDCTDEAIKKFREKNRHFL